MGSDVDGDSREGRTKACIEVVKENTSSPRNAPVKARLQAIAPSGKQY